MVSIAVLNLPRLWVKKKPLCHRNFVSTPTQMYQGPATRKNKKSAQQMNGKQALGLPFPEQKQNNDQEWKCECDGSLGEHAYARDNSAPKQPGRIIVLITLEKTKKDHATQAFRRESGLAKWADPAQAGIANNISPAKKPVLVPNMIVARA